MNLEGSLDSFGLPDVLSLLSSTRKTGALLLTRPDGGRGLIRLADGRISAATADLARRALAGRLVASGLLADEALDTLADRLADHPEVGLATAVRDSGLLGDDELARIATETATDAVAELLAWQSGGFSFDVDAVDPEPLAVSLDPAELLAEGNRRRESLAHLGERMPPPESVLALALEPPVQPMVTRDEWRLLALVDGRRQLRDVVALAGGSEVEVLGAVADLVERGLLVATADSDGHLGGLLRRQEMLARLAGSPVPLPEPDDIPAQAGPPPARSGRGSSTGSSAAGNGAPVAGGLPQTAGALAMAHLTEAAPDAAGSPGEDDAAVTKSLLLRLIAGVKGL